MPEAIAGIDKPVVCSFMGAKDVAAGATILRKAGVPNYPFPEDGVKSLAAAHWLVSCRRSPAANDARSSPISTWKAPGGSSAELLDGHTTRYLTQAECRPVLGCYRPAAVEERSGRTTPTRPRKRPTRSAGRWS